MKCSGTGIPGLVCIEPRVFEDERGYFMQTFHQGEFADAGLNLRFVQSNHSYSIQGTLRGLHYQIRRPQGKLVRVARGEAFDVAVDLRRSSPTFGHWVGITLSEHNKRLLWIPEGFAHGFYVTSPEGADFVYACTDLYAPEHERAIRWDDPELAINWPLVDGRAPSVSAKDAAGQAFRNAELFP